MEDRERAGARTSGASATQRVYETVKEDILAGRIPPGSMLSEGDLASRFGVSRTPIRRALVLLASDGLLTALPQRGHLVRSVSLTELLDAFRLRELLEVEAAGLASQRITGERLAELRALFSLDPSRSIPDLNRAFHMSIAEASGNRILADFVQQLLMLMQQVLILDPRMLDPREEGIQDELDILAALEAHDEPAAREAMRKHLQHALASIWQRK